MLRFIRKSVRNVLIALLVLLTVAFFVFTDTAPILSETAAPTPEDVASVREFVRNVRSVANDAESDGGRVVVTAEELNSTVLLGSRLISGFRGEAEVTDDRVLGRASIPLPGFKDSRWVNIDVEVPEYEGGFVADRVSVSGVDIPPGFAVWAVRRAGNLIVGNQFGDRVIDAGQKMAIDDGNVWFLVQMDDVGQNGVMRGVFGGLRGSELPDVEVVLRYEDRFARAMLTNEIAPSESFLPYLKFALETVLVDNSEQTIADDYTAALLALAKLCGAQDFALLIGGIAFDENSEREGTLSCKTATLRGRIDSRRHFLTAAALQAASNSGFSVSVGEFKELKDALKQSGGFDFTDLAANNSGIRMSDYFTSLPVADWARALDRMQVEDDIIISFEGIPGLTPRAEFEEKYEDVDSAAYGAELERIERRIDRLRLFATE